MDLPHWKFFIAAALVAFCGTFQMSYHSCIINVPQAVFMDFINRTNIERTGSPMSDDAIAVLWGWIVIVFSIGGLVGAVVTSFLAEKFGRKFSLMILCNLVAVGSSLLMSFSQTSHSYEMLAVGRFTIGISAAVSATLLPVYLMECSPINHRGLMGSLQNVVSSLTGLFSFAVAIPQALGTWNNLPYLLGLSIVPALLGMLTSLFLMESPKYLYIKRKNVVAAEKSVRFWFASSDSSGVDVKEAFEQFDQEAEAEAAAMKEQVGVLQAMKVPYFRKALIVSTIILSCQTLTGAGVVYSYSTGMFIKLGLSKDAAGICTIMNSVVGTISVLIMAPFIDRYSRRAFFFVGYGLLFVSLFAYTIFSVIHEMKGWNWAAYAALAFMYFYSFTFTFGAGPLTYVIPSEMSPQAIRSTVLSVGYGVSWFLAIITTFIYPPLALKTGPWSLFMFIIPLLVCLIYLFKFMPETGGKTVAEIMNENAPKATNDDKLLDPAEDGYDSDALLLESENENEVQ